MVYYLTGVDLKKKKKKKREQRKGLLTELSSDRGLYEVIAVVDKLS
jgi:hypothetical protein